MKHLMITALLAIITITASAQFSNNSTCDLRIRAVCIDESGCNIVPGSQGPWTTISAMSTGSIPTMGACAPNTPGWEVSFATGCTGSIVFTTNGATMCTHGSPAWPPGADEPMPSCTCDMGAPVHVNFQYDPMIPILTFDAH